MNRSNLSNKNKLIKMYSDDQTVQEFCVGVQREHVLVWIYDPMKPKCYFFIRISRFCDIILKPCVMAYHTLYQNTLRIGY